MAKKYKDMNNEEIREIEFENCPCQCCSCPGECGAQSVEDYRKHLSEALDK